MFIPLVQVQQSLLQQHWPNDIRYHDEWEGHCQLAELLTASQTQQHHKQQQQQQLQGTPSLDLDPFSSRRASLESPSRFQGWLSDQIDRGDAGVTSDTAAGGDAAEKDQRRSFLSTRSITSFVSQARSGSPAGVLPVTTSYPSGGSRSKAGGRGPGSGGSRRHGWFQQLLRAKGNPGCLFKGLRVRMGVATGVVAKGQKVKNSQVYQRAQGTAGKGARGGGGGGGWWSRERAHSGIYR